MAIHLEDSRYCTLSDRLRQKRGLASVYALRVLSAFFFNNGVTVPDFLRKVALQSHHTT